MGQVKNKVVNRNYAGQVVVHSELGPTMTGLSVVDAVPAADTFPGVQSEYVFYARTLGGAIYWRYQTIGYRDNSADEDVLEYVSRANEVIDSCGRCLDTRDILSRDRFLHVVGSGSSSI